MFIDHELRAAFGVLPIALYSPEAVQIVYAIGFQESGFEHRKQVGGPARGFWQFELGGVRGVMAHPTTGPLLGDVLLALKYPLDMNAKTLQAALEHNDVLAGCMARLNLLPLPQALPVLTDMTEGWKQYKAAWRPGKPHSNTWSTNWDKATERRQSW